MRHPCILGHPQTKGDKIRSGGLTPAFSGAQKRAEMLRHLINGLTRRGPVLLLQNHRVISRETLQISMRHRTR